MKPYRDFQASSGKNDTPPSVFHLETGEKRLFRSGLDFREHHFSGLLLVKKMEPQVVRAVFTTELGLKMFDLELTTNGNKWHHCFEQMNYPFILNLIESDLNLLFGEISNNIKTAWKENQTHFVSISKTGDSKVYLLQQKQSGRVEKIQLTRGVNRKISTIEISAGETARTISIFHPRQQLSLQLELLEE